MTARGIHGVWGSRWTFTLAATGSAVGLGNIWKFPYMTGENGGGAFVLIYLACILTIGVPVMIAEVLMGRRGAMSPINSMRHLAAEAGAGRHWHALGWMGVMAGLCIMAFYSVVAGWTLHYIALFATGGGPSAPAGETFGQLLANPWRLLALHTVFSLITALVVALGVNRGLGAVSKYMMPFLFFSLLILVGYSFANGDFAAGARFLFHPGFDEISRAGVLQALGHAFFTLSLGMGAIMAYGAYMPRRAPIGKTVLTIAALDTMVALLAGLAIFPIVFATEGLEPSSGPGLLFVSLPVAFAGMPVGGLFGALFFALVAVAAWSSSVSLIEPAVAWLVERLQWSRWRATALVTGTAWLLGISCVLSFNLWAEFKPAWLLGRTPFDFLDFLTSQLLLPLGGLLIALFVGWVMRPQDAAAELRFARQQTFDLWRFTLRYISPVLVILVLIVGLVDSP